MFDQYFEDSKCFWPQGYCARALPQALVRQIESKPSKCNVLHGLHAVNRPAEDFLYFD
jgi:hypothetical protein